MATLTFGQHRGRELSDPEVPTAYLRWLLTGCRHLPDWLAEEVRAEIDERLLCEARRRRRDRHLLAG